MYLCFCKSTLLALLYKDCVCNECDADDATEAMDFGFYACDCEFSIFLLSQRLNTAVMLFFPKLILPRAELTLFLFHLSL